MRSTLFHINVFHYILLSANAGVKPVFIPHMATTRRLGNTLACLKSSLGEMVSSSAWCSISCLGRRMSNSMLRRTSPESSWHSSDQHNQHLPPAAAVPLGALFLIALLCRESAESQHPRNTVQNSRKGLLFVKMSGMLPIK